MATEQPKLIDVERLAREHYESRTKYNPPLVKPCVREIARSTAARRKAQEANYALVEKARDASRRRVGLLRARQGECGGHCGVNYFDNAVLTNTDVLHQERHRALRFAQIGDYTRHKPDFSAKLLVSERRLVFTRYLPLYEYVKTITITNPTAQQRRFQVLPPRAPFAIQNVAGCLAPGESARVDVHFRPLSYGFYAGELELRSGDEMQCVELVARNLPWCPRIERVVVDDVEMPVQVTSRTEGFLTEIGVDVGSINKAYSRPHTCRIYVQNESIMATEHAEEYFGRQIKSTYAQATVAQTSGVQVDNAVHIIGADIHSATGQKEVQVYISREQFLQCEFRDMSEHESDACEQREDEFQLTNTALQQYLCFEREVFATKPDAPAEEPFYQVHVKRNGLFCLELDFGDALTRENTHQVYIDTLEEYVLKINFACEVVDGSVTVLSVTKQLTTMPIRAVVDLNNEQFKAIYAGGRLPTERVFPISVSIDCDADQGPVKRQIALKVDGIDARKLRVQLRAFQEQLLLGYLSDTCEPLASEFFALEREVFDQNASDYVVNIAFQYPRARNTLQMQHSPSQYLHRQTLAKPGPKRAILDISYVHDASFTLFRAVLLCIPILRSYSHTLLVEHNMGVKAAITQLQRSALPQTDYLLISEPAVDLGVIPVQTGADFSFQVKNCSKTCYIPYIVSTNLHCDATSLVTVPTDFGVCFRWAKNNEISESEVLFPDVCQVFYRSFVENLHKNLNCGMPANYQPQYLRKLQTGKRDKPDSREARRQMMHLAPETPTRNGYFSYETEPVIAFPHAGIIPPQAAVTVSIRVRPLSLGPIEAFIVINTPTAGYYERVLKAIHARVAESQPGTLPGALSRGSSTSGLLASRCGVRVPSVHSLRCGANTNVGGLYNACFDASKRSLGSSHNKVNSSYNKLEVLKHCASTVSDEQDMKLFDYLREKAIPLSELYRLFSQQWQQSVSMEGGFLSERDVCCRVYGIVAATEVYFAAPEFAPATDQLQPVAVQLVNRGRTQTDVSVEIVSGDASFVSRDSLPVNLEPYALYLWLGKQPACRSAHISMQTGEQAQLLVIPGLTDSIAAVKKPIAAFGVMAQKLDQDLIDVNQNIIISVCKIMKRLEPLRPFVYLPFLHQSFAILAPATRLPDFCVSTRPYGAVLLQYIIINPSSLHFDCEVIFGPDVVAPYLLRVPAQSKAAAYLALNPDRAGEVETFIYFHDAQMRINIKSFGPDVVVKSPFIQQYANLISCYGMVELYYKQNVQIQNWEKLVEVVPKQIEIKPIELDDFNYQIEQGSVTFRDVRKYHRILDLNYLQSESLYQKIVKDLPYIILQNQGGIYSYAVNLSVFNPTGSSVKIAPKIVPIGPYLVTLRAEAPAAYGNARGYELGAFNQLTQRQNDSYAGNSNLAADGRQQAVRKSAYLSSYQYCDAASTSRVKLVVGGPLTQNGAIDSPYFVCAPSELELYAQGRAEVAVRATNMKRLGKYEGILQINGIYIRLECTKGAPVVYIRDGESQILLTGDYSAGAETAVPLENKSAAKLTVALEIGAPFVLRGLLRTYSKPVPELAKPLDMSQSSKTGSALVAQQNYRTIELPAAGCREILVAVDADTLAYHLQFQRLPANPALADLLTCERASQTLRSALEVKILSGDSEYAYKYYVQAFIDAPSLSPRMRILDFQPTFPRAERLQFAAFENDSAIAAQFTVVHVPLADFAVSNFEVCGTLECVSQYEQRCEQRYARDVLTAARSSFSTLADVFYDVASKKLVIDDSTLFQFDTLRGSVSGHGNKRPLGSHEFYVRFSPGELALDRTMDCTLEIMYKSVFYVRVAGGRGAFIVCSGAVNHCADDI